MSSITKNPAELRALIIEDNAEHSMLLARILTGSAHPRFSVKEAATLEAGLLRIREGKTDIVLLDLSLPDSQGLATFERVGAVAGNIPIVVLSGISDVSVAIEALQKGAQDYLVKGHVDNHLLLRSIQYAVERKSVQVELRHANEELEVRVRERTSELASMNDRLQRELSERRRAEKQLLQSNQQLAAALEETQSAQRDLVRRERFQALAQMAKGIAHEFNNVLTPIVGYSDHLLRDSAILAAPEHVRLNIQRIRLAALAGSKAVARVQDVALSEAGAMAPVVVADLVKHVVGLTQPKWKDEPLAAGRNIAVVQAVGPVPPVNGDPGQLREALTHLIVNAVQAVGRRGRIQIGAHRRPDNFVAIFVQDDGGGMTDVQLRHCLDPKANAGALDRRPRGFAVIHNIVARHHGRLEIESIEGRGTKVCLVLPAVAAGPVEPVRETIPPTQPTPGAEPESASNSANHGNLRILVADDEPMVREVIRLYLLEDHHTVESAEDGADALKKFQAGTFDLVLTDRAMPELSGDQLAAEIKKLRPEVPVILLTGFGDLMNAEGEKPPGIDAVVSKPFTMASLRKALEALRSKPVSKKGS